MIPTIIYTGFLAATAVGLIVTPFFIARHGENSAPEVHTKALRSIIGGYGSAVLILVTLASSFVVSYGEVGALDTQKAQTIPTDTEETLNADYDIVTRFTLATELRVTLLPTLTISSIASPAALTTAQWPTQISMNTISPTRASTATLLPTSTMTSLSTNASPTFATMEVMSATAPSTSTNSPKLVPTEAATPTATVSLRANSTQIRARYNDTPLSIDGDLRDWEMLPFNLVKPSYGAVNWQGPSDQSGKFAIAWDMTYLYICAQILDDAHVQNQSEINIFKGDSLDVVLDTELEEDYLSASLNADDYQLGLSPGDLHGGIAAAQAYLWYPRDNARALPSVLVGSKSYGASGFQLEAAIPWTIFNISPRDGMVFGFVLSSSDNDLPYASLQQTMVSTVHSRNLSDPTTWGTLVLDF